MDSVDINVENPWCRALYYYTRFNIFSNEIKAIAKNIEEPEITSRKSEIIQAVMEMLVFFSKKLEGKSREDISKLLIPANFPAFINLQEDSLALFYRLHHAYSFYSSENLLSDYGENISKALTPTNYELSSHDYPLYYNYLDVLNCESAYNFSLLFENLNSYHYSSRTNYIIAKGISQIMMDSTASVLEFIENYQNIENFDWKIEYSSNARWARVLHLALEFIQKEKDWELSVAILTKLLKEPFYATKRGYWWERLIIILRSHLGLKDYAEQIIKLALTDPFVRTGKRLKFENQADKLTGSSYKITDHKFFDYNHELYSEIFFKAESTAHKGRLKFLNENNQLSVEEFALEKYKDEGWKGYHSENSILTSIYGILMWEFIFYDKIPYVFQLPYQGYPLDFRSNDFFSKREAIFNKIIYEINTSLDLGSYFIEKYEKYYKKLSTFVNWELLETWGKEFIKNTVERLSHGLGKILEVMSRDYRHYCSGMPDLILLRDKDLKFVEVKSTNDRLSDQQKMWIRLLTTSGIKVELYHVHSN